MRLWAVGGKGTPSFEGRAAHRRLGLTGSWDKTARVWDVATGREIQRLEGHTEMVKSVAFSPDGRWALTGSNDKTTRLWDVATGREVRRIEGDSLVNSVAFTPDGRLALVQTDDEVRVLGVATGQEIRRLPDFGGSAMAISADGRLALTSPKDGMARLWEVATGREVRHVQVEQAILNSVALSPDARWALTSNDHERNVRMWEVATGLEIRQLEGHSAAVLSEVFSPDGRWILTASWDGTTRLWDAATGDWRATLVSFKGGGWAVVDPEGRYDAADPDNSPGLHWVTGRCISSASASFGAATIRRACCGASCKGRRCPRCAG